MVSAFFCIASIRIIRSFISPRLVVCGGISRGILWPLSQPQLVDCTASTATREAKACIVDFIGFYTYSTL